MNSLNSADRAGKLASVRGSLYRKKHPDVYATLESINVKNKDDMNLIANWPKIINSRNPYTRLYSAWNDESRSFPRYENGSIIYYGMDLNQKFKNKDQVSSTFKPPLAQRN